ncbi:MAG: hypothetical protein K6E78_10160 [Treponema sp.]|nr:hypothetical protein [Treponema sp.]
MKSIDGDLKEEKPEEKSRKIIAARFFLLLLASVLILSGILSGDAAAVFSKAVRICLECIGIG